MRAPALGVAEVGRGGAAGGRGVRELVSPEVAVASEDLLAVGFGALVRLDVGVGQQMGLQVGPLVEASAALVALVRRVLHVQDAVDGQSPGLTEAFAAILAFERLFLRVDVSEAEQLLALLRTQTITASKSQTQ